MALKHGKVWWGRSGPGISSEIGDRAREQIRYGVDTLVYLASEKRVARAHLQGLVGGGVSTTQPAPEPRLVPSYYRKEFCSVWFLLSDFELARSFDVENMRLFNHPFLRPNMSSARNLVYLTEEGPPTQRPTARSL